MKLARDLGPDAAQQTDHVQARPTPPLRRRLTTAAVMAGAGTATLAGAALSLRAIKHRSGMRRL
jgi:hypothetical protein